MNCSYQQKISKAEKILEQEREDLLRMVTSDGIDDFGSPRDFMFIREEDAKYRLKSLDLPENLLKYYLNKICEIYGPYSDDIPDKKRRYYDNDIYLGI